MNNIWVLGSVAILCLIAGVITYRVLKEEEQKQKTYKESGDSVKGALQRSQEYEEGSLKSNVPILSWIYIIAIVVSLVAFALYLF